MYFVTTNVGLQIGLFNHQSFFSLRPGWLGEPGQTMAAGVLVTQTLYRATVFVE